MLDLKELIQTTNIHDLYKRFSLKYNDDEILEKFSGVSTKKVQDILSNGSGSSIDLFSIQWALEILLSENPKERLEDLRFYLTEWKEFAKVITELDEGELDEKDLEQIDLIHRLVTNDIEQKMNVLL
ncbi:hypothetical protein P4475_17900 [Halalkalibacterium halodurans]|uniref:hypothetical protein n=1 Tax=Halalkalibacterium halodurans TaxID=86665 RepID=UPI002E1E981C|nr:hypothetical protein [Halalkalibacterium halodurans]